MERSRNKRRRRRYVRVFGRRVDPRRLVPFACFLLMFIISAAMLGDYAVRSIARKSDNIQMAQGYEDAFVGREVEVLAPLVDSTTEPIATAVPLPTATPAPKLLNIYHDFSGEVPDKAGKLYIQNSDLVGWLYIKGVVSLPVVQRDNSFYLNHNFEGQEDKGGTLFLDQHHPMSEGLQHLLIHGHNMHDSSMFGIVGSYYKLDMVRNSAFATFSTMHAPEDYVICAVLRVSPDAGDAAYFPYVGTPNFSSEAAFYAFAEELQSRSMFDIPVDLQPSDALLSLSTCIDDDRLLVTFRRIREGETREELQSLINQARKK